ncbi:MAG: sce7726 family protein [Lachnospiraceae bacterium]|nr:sce7726 family protein [Lachnospiraceae bacterium]
MRNTEEELTDSSIEGKSTHIKKEPLKDKDIREPLFTFLEEYYGKMRIIEEKTMGKSRADVVMVLPDALYGIEIKSDADTYVRLADQIKDYDRYFDYNIIVVGTSHGEHVPEHVPAYWGIITVEIVDEKFDFYVLRKPLPNPKVKWKKKLELLWRPELAQLQEWNEMPKYKQLSKAKLFDKILERVPEKISEELLRAQVSELLFERDYSKVQEVLAEYRKGELEKQIEQETDPEERKRLMDELKQRQRIAKKNLGTRPRRRRRRKII